MRSPADSAPFEVSSSWEWRRMGDLFSNMSEPAYKKDAHISYHQGGQNGKGLRGGNIGEEPFFFEGDGAFISGDLVKPELYLRKNYMIAPAFSSPDRIGKNALIDRDYSDVFTACSVQAFSNPEIRSRHGFSAFRAHGCCLLSPFRFSEWNTWPDARPTPSESSSPRRRRGMRGLRRFCPLPTPR